MARNTKQAKQIAEDWESIAYCRDERSEAHNQILEDLKGAEILVAAYENEGYDGTAMVVYIKDGKLFEVNGGHCSCHGLEGQWSPEETSLAALEMRSPWQTQIAAEHVRLVKLLKRRANAAARRRDSLQEMADGA